MAQQQENVDDLDDLLEQFPKSSISQPAKDNSNKNDTQVPSSSSAASPDAETTKPVKDNNNDATTTAATADAKQKDSATNNENNLDFDDDAFNAELARGMEKLLNTLGPEKEQSMTENEFSENAQEMENEFRKFFDDFLKGGDSDKMPPHFAAAAAAQAANAASSSTNDNNTSSNENDFQSQIRDSLNRLKTSNENISSEVNNPEDPLAALLSGLGGGSQDEAELQKALDGFMGMLMTRDVLYEPMLELSKSFPPWLEENSSKLSADELDKRRKQNDCVQEIVKIFDEPGFSTDKPDYRSRLSKAVEEMQDYGPPPKEIMGPVPEGMELGADGMPQFQGGENCIIS